VNGLDLEGELGAAGGADDFDFHDGFGGIKAGKEWRENENSKFELRNSKQIRMTNFKVWNDGANGINE
jgi:hypothetical protein